MFETYMAFISEHPHAGDNVVGLCGLIAVFFVSLYLYATKEN